MEAKLSNIKMPPDIINKWQKTVNLLTSYSDVSAGLLLSIHEQDVKVLISSKTADNPYRQNEKMKLNNFPYCSEVISKNQLTEITDALASKKWGNSLSLNRNMISFLGIPVMGPDKSIFGILCVLSKKEKKHSSEYKELIVQFRDLIEAGINSYISDKEQQYLNLADAIFVAINKLGEITLINRKGCEILGYGHDEIIGKNWFDNFLPKAIINDAKAVFDRLIEGEIETVEYYENPIINKNGEQRIISWHNTILRDSEGNINGTLSSGEDVTEHKNAILALKESEEKFRNIFDSSKDAIIISDFNQNILIANRIFAEVLGLPHEELTEKRILHFIHDSYKNKMCERLNELKISDVPPLEVELITNNNVSIPVEINSKKIEYTGKDAVLCVFRDLSERKKAETELKQSEERYRMLVETMNDGLGVLDTKKTIIYTNSALCKMLGYSHDEIINKNIESFFDDGNRKILREQLELRRKGIIESYEIEWRGKNNKRVITHMSPQPIFSEIGKYQGSFAVVTDVTELKQREENYRTLIENMPIVCFTFDKKGKFLSWNKEAEKVYGYSKEEAIGKSSYDLIVTSNTLDATKQKIREVFAGKTTYDSEWQDKNKYGDIGWRFGNTFPMFRNDGSVNYGVNMNIDITDRKNAELALVENEQRYRCIVENAVSVIVGLTSDYRIFEFNPEAEKLFGKKKKEILGKNYLELFVPEYSRNEVADDIKNVLKGKPTRGFENDIISSDGTLHNTIWNINRIYDLRGTPFGIIAIGNDITKRNKAETAHRESEERYKRLSDATFEGIAITRKGEILDVNDQICSIYGYTYEEFKQLGLANFVHPDDREMVLNYNRNNRTTPYVHRGIKKDGSVLYLEIHADKIKINNEDCRLTVIRDITEYKKAEQALRESEERYRIIAETSPDAVTTTDMNGIVDFASNRTAEIHGYNSRDEIIGKSSLDLIAEEDRERAVSNIQQTLEKETVRDIEYKCIRKDGSEFYAELSAAVLKNIDNEPVGFLAITKDITEKRDAKHKLEERLLYEKIISELSTRFVNLPTERVNDEIINGFDYIGRELNIDRIYLWEITEDLKDYQVNCAWVIDGIIDLPVTLKSDSFPYLKRELLNRKIFKFSSIEDIPETAVNELSYYIQYGIKSSIVIPLVIADKVIGCISLSVIKEERIWTVELIRLFLVVGHVISSALQRKSTELKLRESEERFRLLIENIPAVTWVTSREGKTTYISPNIEKVYGYTPEEIYKAGSELWFRRIHPEDADNVKNRFQELFSENKTYNLEYRIKRKDGNWIWLHDRANIFQEIDNVIYAYGVFSDITMQKNAELKIRENEIQYRTLYENANDAIFLLRDNIFIDCNPKSTDLFGYESHDIIGKKPYELSPEYQPDGKNSKEKSNELMKSALNLEPQRFEWIHKRKDDSLFTAEVSLNSIVLKNEKLLLALVRDITERKQKQQEILRAVIKAEEKERNRIARDIHDGVSPILSTIKLLTQSMISCEDELLQRKLASRIENAVKQAITSLSEISIKLSPHILQNFGVVEAIKYFTKEISSIKNVKFNFKTNIKERLNENIEITIYRIVIELINNTVKYADASKIDIILLSNVDISMVYKDDGKGFDIDKALKKKKGMGLYNLGTRIESVSGKYNIYSAPGKGFKLEVMIPQNE